jgi:hypothetical protein
VPAATSALHALPGGGRKLRNGWSESTEIGGRIRPKQVVGLLRNAQIQSMAPQATALTSALSGRHLASRPVPISPVASHSPSSEGCFCRLLKRRGTARDSQGPNCWPGSFRNWPLWNSSRMGPEATVSRVVRAAINRPPSRPAPFRRRGVGAGEAGHRRRGGRSSHQEPGQGPNPIRRSRRRDTLLGVAFSADDDAEATRAPGHCPPRPWPPSEAKGQAASHPRRRSRHRRLRTGTAGQPHWPRRTDRSRAHSGIGDL